MRGHEAPRSARDPMKLASKSDRKIFAAGRSAGRTSEKKRSKGRQTVEGAAELAAAWGGQKFLADRKTPYFESVPMQYSVGGLLIALSMWGRSTDTKDLLGSAGMGLVAGQLAVDGYKNQSSLPGA